MPQIHCAERDRRAVGAHGEETRAMRAALAEELAGADGVELSERPDPAPAAGRHTRGKIVLQIGP